MCAGRKATWLRGQWVPYRFNSRLHLIREAGLLDAVDHFRVYNRTGPVLWGCYFLRSFWLPAPALSRPRPLCVYTSRREARGRRVRTEVEPEALLTGYGFVTHVLPP